MKKTLGIFLFITSLSFGQETNKKVDTFLNVINCKEILNKTYNEMQLTINDSKKTLFENNNVDFNNKENIREFDAFLIEEIELFKNESYIQISAIYSSNYSDKAIQSFINKAKKKEYKNSILIESNFNKNLDSIVSYFQSELNNDINVTFIKIRAKNSPLKLKILQEGNEVDVKKLHLEMFLITTSEQYKKIPILNNINSEINIPENFDHNSIKSLIIKYNDNEYIVERHNASLPEPLREISSPLKKEAFDDLEFWTLNIDSHNISLKTKVEIIFEK